VVAHVYNHALGRLRQDSEFKIILGYSKWKQKINTESNIYSETKCNNIFREKFEPII
jgi:hypothetical protein